MSLQDYVLNGPSLVIQADDRDPWVSWRHHLERTANDPGGPRGGVDLVARVGTPVYAPTDGWMDHRPDDGGAGNSCRFRHSRNVGWADVFSHLDDYATASGAFVQQGDLIAWTGDTGGVDAHLHRHLLDPASIRRNPWDYFTGQTAGGTGSPIGGEDDMEFQLRIQERSGGLGRTLYVNPNIISHVVHDDVVDVNNYVGVPGGGTQLQVSLEDARRLIEVRGFDADRVFALKAGQGLRLDGTLVNAGAKPWPAVWG